MISRTPRKSNLFGDDGRLEAIVALPVPKHDRFLGGNGALMFKVARIGSGTVMDESGPCNCFMELEFEPLITLVYGHTTEELEEAVCIARCHFMDQAAKIDPLDGLHDGELKKAEQWRAFYERHKA